MRALISAELMRLRTVRAPRYLFLGVLVLVGLSAAPIANGPPASANEIADNARGVAQIGVFVAAVYAANNIGDAYRRGAVAMTFLMQPLRNRVAAAQVVSYAAVSFVIAAALAGVAVGIVLPVPDANHLNAGFSAVDVARVVLGAAFGGAVFGAAGALAGSVARHPGIATGVVVAWYVVENLFTRGGTKGGIGPYAPFQLIGSLTGLSDKVPGLLAMTLLLGYLAVLALAVRAWALPRDLT
jgi:hypothetical protein